jgi:hypothetical protein
VLAYLYRNVSLTTRSSVKSIFRLLILLQIWAWTWFSVSRPAPITPYNSWGEPDLNSCQPYRMYWTCMHYFIIYNLYFVIYIDFSYRTGRHTLINAHSHAGLANPRDSWIL